MDAPLLQSRPARDIDVAVEKVLRDLGTPEPPLKLGDVRRLLSLDRAYYSSTSGGAVSETIHRLTIAGKQVLDRPSILCDNGGQSPIIAALLPLPGLSRQACCGKLLRNWLGFG
jgi:hypothetical protein